MGDPEVLSDHADRLLAASEDFLASDLLAAEAANTLCKKTSRGEISSRVADAALGMLLESGIDLRATRPLLPRAIRLARALRHPVYDCVYVALVKQERAPVVTADSRPLRPPGCA